MLKYQKSKTKALSMRKRDGKWKKVADEMRGTMS